MPFFCCLISRPNEGRLSRSFIKRVNAGKKESKDSSSCAPEKKTRLTKGEVSGDASDGLPSIGSLGGRDCDHIRTHIHRHGLVFDGLETHTHSKSPSKKKESKEEDEKKERQQS